MVSMPGMGPRIVITADTKQAVAAVSEFQMYTSQAIGGVVAAANLGATALKGLGIAFIGLGAAAMVTYGAVSSFNQSLTHVRALGNLTQQEMNQLAQSVNRVSVAYGVSGDVIAEGTVVLAKAGLTVDQINESIGAMTALSKANAISFEEAANMTVFAVETFHKEYSDVTDILDKMQVAAQQSILDIGDLQKAFAYAGSTAMMTGVSYEELLTIMAVLSNRALEAGISARSTNKMLLDIVQHAPQLEKFYQNMGKNFNIIEDGTINFTALVEALSDATVNVEFLQGATDIFTVRALRAFGLLAGASEDYTEMLGKVTSAQGELERTVDVQLTALSARLDILKHEMVAMIRSPEVMAALDLLVTSFERLSRNLIPEFTAALMHATQAFVGLMQDGQINAMLETMVKMFLNLLKVAANLARVLLSFNGALMKVAVGLVMFKYLTIGFIQQLYAIGDAFMQNLVATQKYTIASKLAGHEVDSLSARYQLLQRSLWKSFLAFVSLRKEQDLGNMSLVQMSQNISTRILPALTDFKFAGIDVTMIMDFMRQSLNLTEHELEELKLAIAGLLNPMTGLQLGAQKIALSFQLAGAAIGNAVSMGMMFATMDFSPALKAALALSAAMNALALGATMYMIMLSGALGATLSGPAAPFVAAGIVGAMGLLAYFTYSEMSKMYQGQQLGGRYAELTADYSPTADTGMFVGGRRSVYDEGGVAPRHQLVYVEPGEQIISKTQGMVGMGSGVNVYVGDVYAQDGTDFADKLADALPRAMQRASYRGTF